MRVLHDLGQASLGANGIAVDTRSIAHMLISNPAIDWTGLLTQHAGRSARRLNPRLATTPTRQQLMAALFLGAIAGADGDDPESWLLGRIGAKVRRSFAAFKQHFPTAPIPTDYSDNIWRNYFRATMPSSVRQEIVSRPYVWTNLNYDSLIAASNGVFSRPLNLDTRGFDILLTPEPKSVIASAGTKVVHRYHDAIPLVASDTMPNADPTKYHFMMMELSRRQREKRFYVCNSLPSKAELLTIWPEVPESSVEVIPCSVSDFLSPAADTITASDIVRSRLSETLLADEQRRIDILERLRAAVPGSFPFVLAVAALEPKKNIPGIVRAYEQARTAITGLKLVLVGNSGWRSETLHPLLRAHFLQGNLYHLEGLPHAELQALYRQAHCLVYPSIAEGFGLPPVEALVCGTPSVCADIPSVRWVMDGAAIFVDPYDVSRIASGIVSLMQPALRQALMANREQTLRRFSPETVAAQWENFFAHIIRRQDNERPIRKSGVLRQEPLASPTSLPNAARAAE